MKRKNDRRDPSMSTVTETKTVGSHFNYRNWNTPAQCALTSVNTQLPVLFNVYVGTYIRVHTSMEDRARPTVRAHVSIAASHNNQNQNQSNHRRRLHFDLSTQISHGGLILALFLLLLLRIYHFLDIFVILFSPLCLLP